MFLATAHESINSIAVRLRCWYFCEIFSLAREQAVVIHKACKITTWSIYYNYRKLLSFLSCCADILGQTKCPTFPSVFK